MTFHLASPRFWARFGVLPVVLAVGLFTGATTVALAAFTGPGVAHLDNGPVPLSTTGCGTNPVEPFFVINQISPTGSIPHTIQITFRNTGGGTTTLTSTGFSSQGNGQNFHYWIDLPANAPYDQINDATISVPAGSSIGQFVWSHTSCITPLRAPQPPPPGATPELGTLALFASGLPLFGGYALMRRRRSRARD